MNICMKALLWAHIISLDAQLVEMDQRLQRAFAVDASVADYANAMLILPHFKEALSLSNKKDLLEWVDLEDDQGRGMVYRSLQTLRKEMKYERRQYQRSG